MDRLVPAGSPVADAVAQIGAGVRGGAPRGGSRRCSTVSAAEMVAACSGGWLLADHPPTVAAVWINTSPHL